jgi:hypothetical protein
MRARRKFFVGRDSSIHSAHPHHFKDEEIEVRTGKITSLWSHYLPVTERKILRILS